MEQYKNLKKEQLLEVIQELTTTTDAGKVIADRDQAQAKVNELTRLLADGDPEKQELQRQVEDLSERLTATEATKGDSRPVVTIKGKAHLVVAHKANFGGRVITAADIVADPKLQEELLANGSGLLLPVEKILAARKSK